MDRNFLAIVSVLVLSKFTPYAVAITSDRTINIEIGASGHRNITLADGRIVVAMPAEFQTIEVTKIIEPARVIEKHFPAETKLVTRRIIKTPAMTVERVIPAETKNISRKVIRHSGGTQLRTVPQVTKSIRITNPLTGKKITKRIVVQPAYEEVVVIPAVFETVIEQVVIREESVVQETIPAEYETVQETVVVSPARTENVVVAAITEATTEKVQVAPARLVLKGENGQVIHVFKSNLALKRFLKKPSALELDFSTSSYQQITETIVVKPAQIQYQTIPAEVETVSETVVVQDAASELVVVPASFKTLTETIIVQAESKEYITIPATFKTEKQTIVVTPAKGSQAAFTETIDVRKLVSPAKTIEKTIPAITQQVTRRVLNTPAKTMERVVPAQTKLESRSVVRTPEKIVSREVPAETVSITHWVRLPEPTPVTEPAPPPEPTPEPEPTPVVVAELIEERFVWPSSNTMPLFTPPKTDIKIDIPNATCGYTPNNNQPSLMQVFDNFSGLLNKYQYPKRVFKYQHGFAILTSPERISEDATNILDADKDERIKLDQHPITGVGSYLQILFTKPTTRYRYLAFIVTADDNVKSTGNAATPEGLQAVFAEGGIDSDLPNSMRNHAFTSEYKCQVWVYEFARIDRDDPITMEGDLFVPATPTLSEFAHKAGSPVLKALFNARPR